MPDTTTSPLDEKDFVETIKFKAYTRDSISSYFDGLEIYGPEANASRRHDLVAQWYDWCDLNYPGTKPGDWTKMANAAKEDVDIRLLVRAHAIPGYAILLFLEACYAVDRALCGTDTEALAKVQAWHMPQEMRAYKYILSKDMKFWWISELTQLEKEIRDPFSSRISVSLRIEELQRFISRQDVIQLGDVTWASIWNTSSDDEVLEPPVGLEDAIDERVGILKTSVEILSKALQKSKQGEDVPSNTALPTNHKSSEPSGKRRIPHAASSSDNGHELRTAQLSPSETSDEERISPGLEVPSSVVIGPSLKAKLPVPDLQHLQSLFVLCLNRFGTFNLRHKVSGLLAWFRHGETACVIALCSVVVSVFFLSWSAMLANSQSGKSSERSSTPDPNLIGNISQSILSLLSSYLVAAITTHPGSLGLHYKSWFWLGLCASVLCSVLGLSFYTTSPLASTILLWAAAFAQIVVPLLLIIKTGAADRRNRDDVERHGD
ncbi:hypothetical protein CJF32_00009348 [Rutstroemia sp. NJR-2017a WRK4]|nr:hypothetical protein CJF32_00009348 [Rutstroemia sp. NJR-2017a WRK4]